MGALSLATDVGTGQRMEHALRTCLLAMRASDALAVPAGSRSTILYSTLLRFLGCTAEASETAVLAGGDDLAFNGSMAVVATADDREALPHLLRHLGEGLPMPRRMGRVAAALSDPGGKARTLSAHCDAGARLAARMGLDPEVSVALAHAYERWDGKGIPARLAGEEVPLAIRIGVVARDVDVWQARAGWSETTAMLRRRRGGAFDPAVVDVFLAEGPSWLKEVDGLDPWDAVVAAEPPPPSEVGDAQLDDVLAAAADFADLKSPWFVGHSRAVSELADAAARAAGLGASDQALTRRAGLVHDLGIVGVPAGVWNRPGSLTSEGWERVRLHPHLGERILIRCQGLAELGADVGAHHERTDGSGYHRGARELPIAAQLVAAADVYRALQEERPQRPARRAADAAAALAELADTGRLSRTAVDAVLAAAGHAPPVPNVPRPAGLTEREVDVLRLIARGRSNKQAAAELGISAKTVNTHLEHIYAKAGVTTRAGATLFAMEHDLLRT